MLELGSCAYDPTKHICAVYDDTFFEINVYTGNVLAVFIPKNFKQSQCLDNANAMYYTDALRTANSENYTDSDSPKT